MDKGNGRIFFSYKRKYCVSRIDRTRAYRLSVKEYNKTLYENNVCTKNRINLNDELRYECHRIKIICPLC